MKEDDRLNFQKLTEYLDGLSGIGVPGCDLAVYQDHEMIYRHQAGYSNAEKTVPMQGDETYCLYSCTKLITTCAAMQLIEAGKLSLDDLVSDYLPSYAHLTVKDGDGLRPARRVMTIRHLMSMQSGMNYDLASPEILNELALHPMATTRQLVEAMAKTPLLFEPGENFEYSLSHDVLAAVIEVASGQKFSDYLQQHIFDPLQMDTISFDFTPKILQHLCTKYQYDEEKKCSFPKPRADELTYRLSPCYESGGAGLIGNVQDYIHFLDAMACNGIGWTGERILSPEMIQLWHANQLGPVSRRTYQAGSPVRDGYSYGLGVRTRVDLTLGGRGPLCEFGWGGAAGAYALIDPVHHISIFYAQHIMGYTPGRITQKAYKDLVYECMGI